MQQSSAVFSLKINTVLLINVLILLCRRQVRFFNMQATLKERECSLCQCQRSVQTLDGQERKQCCCNNTICCHINITGGKILFFFLPIALLTFQKYSGNLITLMFTAHFPLSFDLCLTSHQQQLSQSDMGITASGQYSNHTSDVEWPPLPSFR